MRKIVQISAIPAVISAHDPGAFAICDDGTFWIWGITHGNKWVRAADIPQESKNNSGRSKGGKARAAKMTDAEKKSWGEKMAASRWRKQDRLDNA